MENKTLVPDDKKVIKNLQDQISELSYKNAAYLSLLSEAHEKINGLEEKNKKYEQDESKKEKPKNK